MRHWLLLLLVLFCVGCTDSSPDVPTGPGREAQAQQSATPPDPIPGEAKQTATGIVTEEIRYTVGGEPFTGFLAYDERVEDRRPGVLVVHEWWGHNAYARSRAVQLAEMGYTAFALDMYGSGKVTDHPDNALQFMREATANPEQLKARFLAAKQILEQQAVTDPDRIAAIGYCFGGGVVLNMARAGVGLDGVASFHGSLAPTVEATPGTVVAKVLVLHGADDAMTPPEQVVAFRAEMESAGVDYEFISYPGASHSFTNPIATELGMKYDMPLAYDKNADEQSWKKLGEFLGSL